MNLDQPDYIKNFLRVTMKPVECIIIIEIIDNLKEFGKYESIESELDDIATQVDETNTEESVISFKNIIADVVRDMFIETGVILNLDNMKLSNINTLLCAVKQMITWDDIISPQIIDIIESIDNDDLALIKIIELATNLHESELHGWIDGVDHSFIQQLRNNLQSYESVNAIDETTLVYLIKFSSLNPELLETQLVSHVLENGVYELEYDDLVSAYLELISSMTDKNVIGKELAAFFISIDHKTQDDSSLFLEDMIEHGMSDELANNAYLVALSYMED